ncbi:MAG: transcription termination factor NusA [Pseudomonadota bacterium]
MAGMFQDLDRILEQVSKDKGIPKAALIEAIESAFLTAARKKWGHLGELESHYNEEVGEIELFQFKTVVDNIENPSTEMSLSEAHELDPDSQMGDVLGVKMDPSVFGRIAAQTAKQVIIQKVREAERNVIFEEFKDRIGEIITGIVRRFEKGDIIVDLGRTEAMLPKEEQVQTENYKLGERIQGLFLKLDKEGKGPTIILSRKSPEFIKQLFTMEVPEISEGIVEIKSVSRESGIRSKIAVYSKDSDVDPVGACVGMKGSRVQSVVGELKGEKIDIVLWDLDPARFVCNAIAPAEVVKVIIREREHIMEVIVPDDQLSLAIGRRGQNVRLAAQLTSWNIDVYSETKIEEIAGRARVALSKLLDIDDSTAIILYSHSYRSIEDIAKADLEEFTKIPGIGGERLKEIYDKSSKAIKDGISTEFIISEIVKAEEAAVVKEKELEETKEAKKQEQAETAPEPEKETEQEKPASELEQEVFEGREGDEE